MTIRIGVVGCGGRMGRLLLRTILEEEGCRLCGGVEQARSPEVGQDLGRLAGLEPVGLKAASDARALVEESDVIIEFTSPEATVHHAGLVAAAGRAHVIGTTGLSESQKAAIARAAERAPIVLAANMSLGVTLLSALIEQVARSLDAGWDIEILEMHHRMKVDAPSGTALVLGEAAARGRGVRLADMAARGRDGITGARKPGQIGFAVLRGGDVVGEHRALFAGMGERIELAHVATDRAVFARGAVKAAQWAAGRRPGLYGIRDVLGLEPAQGPAR
jgi:4-hydroxy-tetrahydrodipicolinate reductase